MELRSSGRNAACSKLNSATLCLNQSDIPTPAKTVLHEDAYLCRFTDAQGKRHPIYPAASRRSSSFTCSVAQCTASKQQHQEQHHPCIRALAAAHSCLNLLGKSKTSLQTYPVHHILHNPQPVVPALNAVHCFLLAQVVPDLGEVALQEDLPPALGVHDHLALLLFLGPHVVQAATCGRDGFVSRDDPTAVPVRVTRTSPKSSTASR